MKKGITIDDLAVMVNKGFEDTKRQLLDIEERFEKRFDRIENILIKQQNERIDLLEKRLHRLEEGLLIK